MFYFFQYKNAKSEISARLINVVHLNKETIWGFDYNKLSHEEQAIVSKVYPNNNIPTDKTKNTYRRMTPEDYVKLGIPVEIFKKAYRTFKKENIIK